MTPIPYERAADAASALKSLGTDPAAAVHLAVDLACRHVPECGTPVVVLCSHEDGEDAC